jgi:hypothetical protein
MSDQDDERISALYRRSRDQQPPKHLDEAIRRHAHGAQRREAFRLMGLRLPQLALAATVLLAVGVMLRVFDVAPPQQPAGEEWAAPKAPAAQLAEPAAQRVAPASTMKKWHADAPAAVPQADSLLRKRESEDKVQSLQRPALSGRAQPQTAGECAGELPPEPDDPRSWRAHIAALDSAGKHDLARCLKRLYLRRFPQLQQDLW